MTSRGGCYLIFILIIILGGIFEFFDFDYNETIKKKQSTLKIETYI